MNNLRKATVIYLLFRGLGALALTTVYTLHAMYYVTVVGMDPFQLVLVGTVLETVYFLGEVPTGVVADVYSRRLSIIIGEFVLGAGFILEGLVPLFGVILLAQAIEALGHNFLSGVTEAWIADEVGDENIGQLFIRGSQVGRIGTRRGYSSAWDWGASGST